MPVTLHLVTGMLGPASLVEGAKRSALVARLIEKRKVVGRLSVAPPG